MEENSRITSAQSLNWFWVIETKKKKMMMMMMMMLMTMMDSISLTYVTLQLFIKLNSGALVRQRTISTERPPLVVEVNGNFMIEGVA
jgi:hypothetical protein